MLGGTIVGLGASGADDTGISRCIAGSADEPLGSLTRTLSVPGGVKPPPIGLVAVVFFSGGFVTDAEGLMSLELALRFAGWDISGFFVEVVSTGLGLVALATEGVISEAREAPGTGCVFLSGVAGGG